MGILRRNDVLSDYKGPAGISDGQASYAPTEYEPSKRQEMPAKDIPHSNAVGRGPIDTENKLLKSYTNYSNHRATVRQPETLRSGFSGAIGAVIAPLMDILRPSRKEEIVNNVRIYGDLTSSVPNSYVINPNDITPTTTKETTLYSPQFNINNQKEGMYVNNYTPMDLTQRDTTSSGTFGNVGGVSNMEGNMLYDSAYRQTNNEIKSASIYNRTNQGGTQIFNQQMNVSTTKMAPETNTNVFMTPNSVVKLPPSKETYGKVNVPQYYNECIGCDRIQGDILQAFKSNPYTHSLTTSV
jgi:hypothetical protein